MGEGSAETINDINADTLAKDILGFEEIAGEAEETIDNI